jgi:hypothetical protein
VLKLLTVLIIAIVLTACASHRQPRAKCSGSLERINVSLPEHGSAPADAMPESAEGDR